MIPIDALRNIREAHTTWTGCRKWFTNPRSIARNRQQCAELREQAHVLVTVIRQDAIRQGRG